MRHQALRSAFSIKNLQLCIFKELPVKLYYQDISLQVDLEKQQAIKDYSKRDSLYLFDLANGPLFKVGLIKTGNYRHYLILTIHHIICDGWSIGIILRELSKLLFCTFSKYSDRFTGTGFIQQFCRGTGRIFKK